ncbi:DNA repair protein RecN [bacterium AH-315-C07]|nr:DNA repair protein RecN [bacterium AH-315-C07]
MFKNLLIKNYALIEELDVEWREDLSIITGETGAGKSILLGALSLVLGQRADSKVLLYSDKKCIVEGQFDLSRLNLQGYFSANDLDYENISIIRREILPSGKSRAFINDTPVNLNTLKELGSKLINIHSQHQTLNLKSSEFQLSVVDDLAGNADLVKAYREEYNQYRLSLVKLDQLIDAEKNTNLDIDYYKFQLDELIKADLDENEQARAESEINVLGNTEEIKGKLVELKQLLSDDEGSLMSQLAMIRSNIESIASYAEELDQISSRINSAGIELEDVAGEIESIEQGIVHDPEKHQLLSARLDLIYQLQSKHRVQTVSELLETQKELTQKLDGVDTLGDDIEKLKHQIETQKAQLIIQAVKISKRRRDVLDLLESKVVKMLGELGMENARLKVKHDTLSEDHLNFHGIDEIKFYFSANKGVDLSEISDVASGGELSRLMLCIKSLLTESAKLPTIIFDEIDSGVSGEVAIKVGRIMHEIAKNHQVIAITHLPQIAAKGKTHYFVYKEEEEGRVKTSLRELSQEERTVEIAKMIGGESVSETSVLSAKELLAN